MNTESNQNDQNSKIDMKNNIKVTNIGGPLNHLENTWHFKDHEKGTEISFDIDFARNAHYIFLAFLFCIVSIFFNALAWKNIVIWFGNTNSKKNFISFYVLTNVLKYVPGGIWHFLERYNFLNSLSSIGN